MNDITQIVKEQLIQVEFSRTSKNSGVSQSVRGVMESVLVQSTLHYIAFRFGYLGATGLFLAALCAAVGTTCRCDKVNSSKLFSQE